MDKSLRIFFKQISIYSAASIDMLLSFELAFKRIRNKNFRKMIIDVIDSLKSGKTVSLSMTPLYESGHLDSICQSIIFSSENSGSLPHSFKKVYEYLEINAKSKNDLILAFSYPILIFISTVFLVIALIYNIFPKITPLFVSMKIPIPKVTGFMILSANFLVNNALYIGASIASVTFIFYVLLKKNIKFKDRFQLYMLSAPVFGKILISKELKRISHSTSLLLKTNNSLYESLYISTISCKWLPMKRTFEKVLQNISRGKRLSDACSDQDLPMHVFEGDWIDLIMSGESTGALPKSFEDISMIHEAFIKDYMDAISRWSEPIALATVAVVTLFVALSVVQPMYAIIQHVNQ